MESTCILFLFIQVAAEISMLKVVVPRMCLDEIDLSIQSHGGAAGLCSDISLGQF